MTDRTPSPPEQPVDPDVLWTDDLLLDALGRGGQAPADDAIAAVLAAWRADLADPADPPAVAADEPADPPAVAEVVPITRARRRRRVRLGVAAAVLAVIAGGTGIAAAQATHGSPLWPITQLVNPQRAAVLDAESAIEAARQAVTEGRGADAQRLVDRAATLISRVRDASVAARLRTELDAVRQLLATATTPAGPPGATPGAPVPGAVPTPGSTAVPGAGQGGGQPVPTPGPTGAGHPPPLPVPSLPVPSLPVPSLPLPSLPVPTSLPPLPLPTPTLLGR